MPNLVCSQVERNDSNSRHFVMFIASGMTVSVPRRKIKQLDRFSVVSCLTLLVPSRNRSAGILDSVVMANASCLTVRVPSGNVITLEILTVTMASCLTLFVPSCNIIAVILYRVFMVMASCLTVSVPRRRKQKR